MANVAFIGRESWAVRWRVIDCQRALDERTHAQPARASSLLNRGAQWCDSPADAAARRGVSSSILRAGIRRRARRHRRPTRASSRPHAEPGRDRPFHDFALATRELAIELGVRCFHADAPGERGRHGAKNATLSIMVGGDRIPSIALNRLVARPGQDRDVLRPSGCGQAHEAGKPDSGRRHAG